jgi:hypothetical protein
MDKQVYNFGSVGSGFDSWLGHFFYSLWKKIASNYPTPACPPLKESPLIQFGHTSPAEYKEH